MEHEGISMSKNNDNNKTNGLDTVETSDPETGAKAPIKPQYKKSTFENYRKHMKNRGGPDASPIQNIMVKTFGKLNIDQKIKEYKIFKHWADAVGPHIAKKTQPKRLMNKKLFVNVSTPTWVTELIYQKEEILERINKTLGNEEVIDIVFRQGTIDVEDSDKTSEEKIKIVDRELTEEEKLKIKEDTAEIKDKDLKETISRTMEKSFKVID